METAEFAADLMRRIQPMRLETWRDAQAALVEEISRRDDMPALMEEFTLVTTAECRARTCIRRAYRKRFGPNANVAHAETTIHRNFGRF